jgi:hypothetical protein
VHWVSAFPPAGADVAISPSGGIDTVEQGYDPAGTYPAGADEYVKCNEYSQPDVVDPQQPVDLPASPDEHQLELLIDREPGMPLAVESDTAGQSDRLDCAAILAQTGTGESAIVHTDAYSSGNPGEASTDFVANETRELVSAWKLIEVQGVQMIEVQLPLMFRHGSQGETEEAMLLIEHEGFVRAGARLPGSQIDRVFTYNETAFTTLRSIVETRFERKP